MPSRSSRCGRNWAPNYFPFFLSLLSSSSSFLCHSHFSFAVLKIFSRWDCCRQCGDIVIQWQTHMNILFAAFKWTMSSMHESTVQSIEHTHIAITLVSICMHSKLQAILFVLFYVFSAFFFSIFRHFCRCKRSRKQQSLCLASINFYSWRRFSLICRRYFFGSSAQKRLTKNTKNTQKSRENSHRKTKLGNILCMTS